MDTISNVQKIKVFMSRYPDFRYPYWKEVNKQMSLLKYKVYSEKSDCDVAIVLNACMFNPSSFKNKVGFVYCDPDAPPQSWDYWVHYLYVPVLKEYFKPLFNVFPGTPEEVSQKIAEYIDEIN